MDGAATSASVRPRACSPTWKRGPAEDCECIFGGSGRTGIIASKNCAVEAFRSSLPRLLPVRRRGFWRMSGHPAVQAALRNHHFDSIGLPDSMFRPRLNPIEPPWYATRMPGGVGGVTPRGVPLSRSLALSGKYLAHRGFFRNRGNPDMGLLAGTWVCRRSARGLEV